jgi:predicted ATPase/DNA-binding SARP family transcriptional activator
VELRVLGPVELVGVDGSVPLGGQKQRRLLAALSLRPGQVLPADVLVDAVWGPRPPPSAAKLLQVYVSQLRKLLEPPIAIRTRPGGYVLEVGDGALDLARFERLLGEGRAAAAGGNPALAASLIGRALGLWRGPAFGDLAYEEFALAEAERLEELRLIAREEQLEAELELGRHFELLPELRSRARAQPLRERAQAQAMVALYRCGLQAEALELYSSTYTRLRDQLGLDLSAELQELQRRILQHDPELGTVRSAARPAASLPAAPNQLLGRERELDELQRMLVRDGVRLLVLSGAGGSGKTRLALAAAHAASQHFANGALFIGLASLRDPKLVLEAVARACGVQQAPRSDPLQDLLPALRSRELLLVLDNFEHLRAAGPDIVGLLAGAPRLTALVTSRVVLHVSGEHVYPVQPLHLHAAVALFCARAREIDPDFSPDVAGNEAIAQVCRRLDGLPLAIELAAARTHVLTPSQLYERLDAGLPLLTGGPHDLPARQRTLRATLEWSHDLLAAEEQRLFRRLGVFASGFDVSAAEAVCDAQLDTLGSLVDQSLVQRLPGGRLEMLETVCELALERLNASGETPGIRERHAVYFRDIALSANLREDAEGEQRHDLVTKDQDNIRAALGWTLENDQIELGLEVAVALESFWWTSAAPEGRRWFKDFLSHGQARGIPPALHARALRAYGDATVFAGDLEGAETFYRHSLDTYRRLGDERGAAFTLHCLAENAGDRGDVATARGLIEESLELLRRVGNKREQAAALKILGKVECDEGNYDLGIESLERAARLAGEAGSRFEQAYCLGELCERAFEAGRTGDTEAWGRQSLTLSQTIGDRQTQLCVLTLLARTALRNGRTRQAGLLWGAVEVEQDRAPPGWWTLTPDDNRYSRSRYIAPLLRQRDPEFEQGREEGRRLSLDDTISRIVGSATQATAPGARPSV